MCMSLGKRVYRRMSSAALCHHLQYISLYLLLVDVGMVHVYHSMCVTIRTTCRSRCLPLGFRDQMQVLRLDGKSLQLLNHLPGLKNQPFKNMSPDLRIGFMVKRLCYSYIYYIYKIGSIPRNHIIIWWLTKCISLVPGYTRVPEHSFKFSGHLAFTWDPYMHAIKALIHIKY